MTLWMAEVATTPPAANTAQKPQNNMKLVLFQIAA